MCRHVAYAGPAIAARDLLDGVEHGMEHQSFAARELLTGSVCADGYGVGWYDDGATAEPARYAFSGPIWSDTNLQGMFGHVRSHMMVSAVRNGTVAGHNTQANCAPFASGRYLFSLNGLLEDFDGFWKEGPLRESIAPERRQQIAGNTDGEYIFQAILDAVGADPEETGILRAMQSVLRDLVAIGNADGKQVELNILMSDGVRVYATRCGNQKRQNSLYTLQDGQDFPGGWLVASEPIYDDPEWQPVAENTLVVLQEGTPAIRLKI